MPPVRDHLDVDDDDDMPTLVDQPMTFTFSTEMTPLSFDPTSTISDVPLAPFTFSNNNDSSSSSQLPPPTPPRTSHGKRRDASYIPRPPNAFILFRSSFIRSQQVSGKVEGNHSNLSKIIGLLWKTLPKEERDEWEAKAAAAQLEHRKRYPDWRFRPGANASAKLKIKDGGGAGSSRQRRIRAMKDPPPNNSDSEDDHDDPEPDDTTDKKGKGKGRALPRRKAKDQAKEKEAEKEVARKAKEEKRFAKIADLLVAGKKGVELEIAVKEWEGGRKAKKRSKKNEPEASTTSKEQVHAENSRKGDVPAALVISVASPDTSQSPSTSPALSIHGPNTQSPLSLWSISTPATPDTDPADGEPTTAYLSRRRRPLPHHDSYPSRRSKSRSRSGSRSASGSPTRSSRPPTQAQPPIAGTTSLTQMFKRSLSAPASDNRQAYPRNPPAPSVSLPLPDNDQRQPPAKTTKRLRHRASESVSYSFNNLHMSPLAAAGQQPPRFLPHSYALNNESLSSSVSSSPPISASSPHHRHQHPYHLHPQTAAAAASTFYHQTSPQIQSPPPRLTWQEEEDRRRMELAAGYPFWWRSTAEDMEQQQQRSSNQSSSELYEPVREGSFEYDANFDEGQQGYPAVGEDGGVATMDQRYLEQFPELPHGQEGTSSSSTTSGESGGNIQWTQATTRLGLVVASPADLGSTNSSSIIAYAHDGTLVEPPHPNSSPHNISTFAPSSTTGSTTGTTATSTNTSTSTTTTTTTTTTLSPLSVTITGSQQRQQQQQEQQQQHSAGQYFYTIPPTPISPLAPFSSSFSSLAGWDGESSRPPATTTMLMMTQLNNNVSSTECSTGDDGSGSTSLSTQRNERGGLQSIGLRGGAGAGAGGGWGTEERGF